MAKDPAVLFYTADFLTGTMFMTDEQTGQYIRALCAQHLHGHLSEDMIVKLTKGDADVMVKFRKDNQGKFYNKRMHEESEKRRLYVESRYNNRRNNKVLQEKHMKNISKTHDMSYEKHMEDEDINEDINEIKKGMQGETKTSKPSNAEKIKQVVDFMNEVCGTSFRHESKATQKHINARISEGFRFADFQAVIGFKFSEWGDDEKMSQYLRPETLFGTKFESYLQASRREDGGEVTEPDSFEEQLAGNDIGDGF